MSPDRWNTLATLVPGALDLPPGQRSAFLDDACRLPTGEIDAQLRAEADALVQSALDATETDALRSPLAGLAGELAGQEGLASVAPPETVGPWRVTGVLGEGGQAVVYRARRADGAFEREVALKLLRPGAPAPRLAARLAEERRVLARLEHPGIARLYDGGLTDGGQPFLAMELVDGAPITAAAVSLGLRQQVELLAEVAQAVAYAHARLVVHRDLKPSNVLVTEDGRPRLLDFGVAKLLGDETDPDLTVPGWMTPAYAAPEQVAGGEVTTATDVYALGVLGYQILAGRRPYETAGLSPAETERLVCHTDPPPASAAASGPRARALRGDLDTILAKALAKEPARRYPTASALADDLGRWLAGLPVEARPATATYRAGRFANRHRAGVTAAALALAAVVAVSGVAFARVTSERDRAEVALGRTEGALAFLDETLSLGDPNGGDPNLPVRAVLDTAAVRVEALEDPAVAALVHTTLANAMYNRGDLNRAEHHADRALALLRPDDPRRLEALVVSAYVLTDRGEGAAALPRAREVAEESRRRAADGSVSPAQLAANVNVYGVVLMELGRFEEAEQIFREVLAVEDAPALASALARDNLALILAHAGDNRPAADLLGRLVDERRQAGPGYRYDLVTILGRYGWALAKTGPAGVEGALEAYQEAVEVGSQVMEPTNPELLRVRLHRANTLRRIGRTAEARREAEAVLALPLDESGLGAFIPGYAQYVAGSLDCAGPDPARGLGRIRAASEAMNALFPPDHYIAAMAEGAVGGCLVALGRPAEARPYLRRAHAVLGRLRDPDDPRRTEVERWLREAGASPN